MHSSRVLTSMILVLALAGSVAAPRVSTRLTAQQGVRIGSLSLENPPEALKTAIATFRQRESSFKSQLTLPANAEFPTQSAFPKLQREEKIIYALFDVPDAAQLAADFARRVSVYYEWEGMASSAVGEAKSALEYLARNPSTPIAAYVHFWVAHRYACAAEMPYETGNIRMSPELQAGYLKKMREQLAQAEMTAQPLLKYLSEDLGRRPRCNDEE